MRVIAGTYKGHRLAAPGGRSTRPTGDRVREALFSILGGVADLRVLDLYAGSGALGIEALSRGARHATFVDSDAVALRAIRQNVTRLQVENATVVRAGAPAFLRAASRRGERWDLVLCDPPYRLAHRLARDFDELLTGALDPEGRIVCESSVKMPLRLELPLVTERRYGDTLITVHRHALPKETR